MQFKRYMDIPTLVSELRSLSVFRGEYVGPQLLESFEAARLVSPRLCVHYPDPIARRFWLADRQDQQPPYQLKKPVEPDGPCWGSAVCLRNALHQWQNPLVYGQRPHPFDNLDPRFSQFIEHSAETRFVPWQSRKLDVGSNINDVLFDDTNIERYYTTWQMLFIVESADAGIYIRMDLADQEARHFACDLTESRKIDVARWPIYLAPARTRKGFVTHGRALDAVVFFAEERGRLLNEISKGQSGRFYMRPDQTERYERATTHVAHTAMEHHRTNLEDLVALIRFLAGRWLEWDRDGRPRIANAYKLFLEQAIVLTYRHGKLTFAELRDRVGRVGGRFTSILDVIWPNWAEEEKQRVRRTLKAATQSDRVEPISGADLDAFVEFLASSGLEAFFWRLKSFEDHALRGNEFAPEGMRSDVQGMAVAVEHIAAVLGGSKTQLYEKFKQIWAGNKDVGSLLKRGDVAILARQEKIALNWPVLKTKIDALRGEKGGKIAADLVMAHRIRGGVHAVLPEDDHFELEHLFVGLMRAAIYSFVEKNRS